MTIIVGSGIPTYEDVSDIIEALVNTEGRKYPIPGMDFEDTAQEIRLECIRVLQFYDGTRIGPSPFKYLQVCVRNFLYNQRRGIWVPNNPPCVRCPLWDKMRKLCTIDEVGCDKIVNYRKSMATKAAIRQPSSLDVDLTDNRSEDEVDAKMLDQNIQEALPPNLLSFYKKMLLGESIPSRAKSQIRVIVLSIINHAENL
jgi:hypothetical protein